MMFVLILISWLTSLYPCYAAWRRFQRIGGEAAAVLLAAAVCYSLAWLYAVVIRVITGDLAADSSLRQMLILAGSAPSMDVVKHYVALCTAGVALLHLLFGWVIQQNRQPITRCLGVIIVLLVTMSCFVASFNGIQMLQNLFGACCGIMAYFAYMLELTYKEFCTLGNIFVQSSVCLLAAAVPVVGGLRCKVRGRKAPIWVFSIVSLAVHLLLFILICVHFWMPLEAGFDLCVAELKRCAASVHSTYEMVNIVIFIILFVVDLAYNALLYRLVMRKA